VHPLGDTMGIWHCTISGTLPGFFTGDNPSAVYANMGDTSSMFQPDLLLKKERGAVNYAILRGTIVSGLGCNNNGVAMPTTFNHGSGVPLALQPRRQHRVALLNGDLLGNGLIVLRATMSVSSNESPYHWH
jgi:hypothetical protein